MMIARFEGGCIDGKEAKFGTFLNEIHVPVNVEGTTGFATDVYRWYGTMVEEGWTMDNFRDYKRELFRFIERREWRCEP